MELMWRLLWCLLLAAYGANSTSAQCPWNRNVISLQGSCACSHNLAQELTLQCGSVDFGELMRALKEYANGQTIDLLYVHNSSISELRDGTFRHLTINNIQLSRCDIRRIGPAAFQGQESSLKNLNLQDNLLSSVPIEALRQLGNLALIDLSGNRITQIPDDAFLTLRLTTLKLADNNITLFDNSFRGLEKTLKNLNLKGTRLRNIPNCVRNLPQLAFLDLAHNNIRNISAGVLSRLDSLTAINLERNFIQTLEPDAFKGVNDTLSSLSLLNNLVTEFPTQALSTLTELRVLDVGFNLISSLPEDAFSTIRALTLLALDGNPLPTLPRKAFRHLNGTLRGLSLGGRYLKCDCKLRWVAEWIRDTDLQVTSRERNPQFCGSPNEFRLRSFYQLGPDDFKCTQDEEKLNSNESEEFKPASPSGKVPPKSHRKTELRDDEDEEEEEEESDEESEVIMAAEEETFLLPPVSVAIVPYSPTKKSQSTTAAPNRPTATVQPDIPSSRSSTTLAPRNGPTRPSAGVNREKIINRGSSSTTLGNGGRPPPARVRPNYGQPNANGRPNLIVASNANTQHPAHQEYQPSASASAIERDVIVKDAYRQDTSIVIQWDSDTSNILGFRVVYRLFGDNIFQPGPPLDPSEREFKIKNVPAQESLVVCVVSLEDSNVTPETVPFSQCREIRTENQASTHMDKIIIAASAAICGTVVIAVVIFICCNRKRSMKSEKLRLNNVLAPAVSTAAASLVGSQAPASVANIGPMSMAAAGVKDWDQMSMYSSRSIPRARMFPGERPGSVLGSVNGGFIPDDARSHVSGYSLNKGGVNLVRSRSLADGQSQRSMSAMSGRYIPPHGLHGMPLGMGLGMGLGVPNMGIAMSRPDLRGSHPSLAEMRISELGGRASRASRASQYSRRSEQMRRRAAQNQQQDQKDQQQQQTTGDESSWETDRERGSTSSTGLLRRPQMGVGSLTAGTSVPNSAQGSNQQRNSGLVRTGHNRSSTRGSMHSTGMVGEADNWTDMDMDIYMAHNTMRSDLVRL